MRKSVAGGIDRHVWLVAAVVAMGSVMSILAVTIVNVALEQLSVQLHSPLNDIQWVATGYLLGMGAVIPLSAWAAKRVGTKRMYLISLGFFVAASLLCAFAWSAPSLIAFRVLQGVAGGLTLPLGQMMLATAAGPQRIGRVMSVIGVPMVLGPMIGPIVGGLLIEHLNWHWIFVINVPFGIAALVAGWRLLPASAPEPAGRLDVRGLVLLCTGVPLLIYGLSRTASAGGFASASVLVPAIAGVLLVAAFAIHAVRASEPLLDIGLLRNRGFAAAGAATFAAGAALYGAMLLLPLYFQTVRGEDALHAGLLLIPQGVGAALSMGVAGRLADRIGGGRVAVAGLAIMALATIPLAGVTADTSYWLIGAVLVVRGFGTGASIMPLMAAAFATLRTEDVAHATPQLNVLQRVGGSIGTAILTVVLTNALAGDGSRTPEAAAAAFGHAYWWAAAVTAFAVLPALYLAHVERRERGRRAALHAVDREILPAGREPLGADREPIAA
ncbi:DHA2 family efflux MFS transporter permease subunit [Capillimicrobium parvum]|uniref:Multidrug export protein EmrB n=1 Tax=Capillimicrobium parvum TaxID=2884022 RepID=A0A9E7C0C6_9ACTN|nr:DHA2 family efflux MFS transporter permease subunit [Capillimicrobium parvum]UGS35397.1 Multidrug export protein EmrB [Capillimicrobium parvum]